LEDFWKPTAVIVFICLMQFPYIVEVNSYWDIVAVARYNQ